jgi:hypothetical protein
MIKYFGSILMAIAVGALVGCGAGSGVPGGTTGNSSTTLPATVQTISGTAATGAPLVGATILVKDSAGASTSGTSAADGTFSIPVTNMKPPFMLVATKTGQQNLYSVLSAMDMASTNTQNVNITPITTLVMYELNGGADPASMYSGSSFSTVTAANVSSKETIVRSKLPANSVNPIFSMMYGKFTATGVQDSTSYDSALDSIGKITAITSTSVTFAGTTPASYTPSAAGAGAGTTTSAATPTIALTLTDTTTPFAARTSIASSSPARITATVKNANGAAIANAIVTFTTSDPRDTFSGGANTALTDASGVATATLTTSNTAGGASTVTAGSMVSGTAVTNSLNYAVGSSTISLSALSLPSTTLSAYGTASISVNVLNNGVAYTSPMTVSFTSACAAAGKATLTASVTTVNGIATASYLDNGCNNAAPGDNITATLMNGVTATGNLPVSSPAIGSIQFVSVTTNPVTTPTMITLKGTGGASRSETARVVFRVVDSAGNPLGNAPVSFSLNTSLGGLALSSLSSTSDPTTGNVVTNVLAGTFSTAVRVTATTGALSTQSDQLLVSTGVPAQDAFSLSASTHNIEGWNYDGTTTTLTARLADHFHNPVPDGTAVYFTSEGGSVAPSCTTVGGVCTAVLTSQNFRPDSNLNGHGRVTVLARATGEEAFIDLNSNGTVDSGPGIGTEMIDGNNVSTDIGEAYVDSNENGIHDANELYIDFNGIGGYTGTTTGVGGVGGTAAGDGVYNGLLCTSGAAICSAQKSIDVRGSQVIIFSTSEAASAASLLAAASVLPVTAPSLPSGTLNAGIPTTGIVLSSCWTVVGAAGNMPSFATVTVVDGHGNAMPAGTKIDFSTNNGSIPTPASYIVPDTIGCRTGFPGCSAFSASSTFGDISVSLVSDAVYSAGPPATCVNTQSSGVFTVTVTSPKGTISTYTMSITD